jgi:hypothetical protein
MSALLRRDVACLDHIRRLPALDENCRDYLGALGERVDLAAEVIEGVMDNDETAVPIRKLIEGREMALRLRDRGTENPPDLDEAADLIEFLCDEVVAAAEAEKPMIPARRWAVETMLARRQVFTVASLTQEAEKLARWLLFGDESPAKEPAPAPAPAAVSDATKTAASLISSGGAMYMVRPIDIGQALLRERPLEVRITDPDAIAARVIIRMPALYGLEPSGDVVSLASLDYTVEVFIGRVLGEGGKYELVDHVQLRDCKATQGYYRSSDFRLPRGLAAPTEWTIRVTRLSPNASKIYMSATFLERVEVITPGPEMTDITRGRPIIWDPNTWPFGPVDDGTRADRD